jgi:hypothetical protein
MHTVIARYKENTGWAKDISHTIIQKGDDMPNIGREPSSFLLFIVNNYEKLQGEYHFVQGNPFDHSSKTLIYSRPDGAPHHPGLDLHSVCSALELPLLDEYPFTPGGQFTVTTEQIKSRPWEWYVHALYLSTQKENPWAFERLWYTIFDL